MPRTEQAASRMLGHYLRARSSAAAHYRRAGSSAAAHCLRAGPNHLALALICALTAVACDDFGFEQFEEVTKLRVLAIRIDPPELGPGQVAHIEALVVDPRDAGPLSYVWEVCLLDEGPDGRYACASDDDGEVLGAVISNEPTAEIDYDLVTQFLGGVDELCALLADVDVPDFIELPDCRRGFPVSVRLTVQVGDGAGENTEIAVKRLLLLKDEVASTGDINANPAIGTVLIGDRPAPADEVLSVPFSEDGVTLQVVVAADQAETFPEVVSDGTRVDAREQLALSWFTTLGRLDRPTSYFFDGVAPTVELQTNEFTFDAGNAEAAPGDEITFWFVLRDNRGGTSFTSRRVLVAESALSAN